MQRFLGLILLGLVFNGNAAWAAEPTVKVFDGQTVKLVPMHVYVESLTTPETVTAPFVDALPSEIADLQQQINDLRAAVAALTARLSSPISAPPAAPVFLGACGQQAAVGACGAAQAGACGAAADVGAGACGVAGSSGVMGRQPVRTFFRGLFGRRGGC